MVFFLNNVFCSIDTVIILIILLILVMLKRINQSGLLKTDQSHYIYHKTAKKMGHNIIKALKD